MALSENDRHDAALYRRQSLASDAWSFVAILRSRILLIGLVTLVFAVAGLMYAVLSVPRFIASGRLLIDRPATEIASQISAMTSPAALDRVIVREKLETDPLFGGKSKGALSLLLTGLGLAQPTDPHVSAMRQLERVISVKRDADSNLIDIHALTRDRDASVRIANAVMDSYVEERSSMQNETARGAAQPSDAPLQTRLKDAEQRLEKYRGEIGSAAVSGVPASEKLVSALSDRLAAAEAKADGFRAAVARTRRTGVDPDTIRGGAVDALRRRYAAAKRLQDDLGRTLGPRHPDMVIAKLQTNEAKRLLDQAIRDRTEDRQGSAAAELERAHSAVTDLKGRLETAKKDLARAKETSARLRELERDVEVSRTAYQAFLAQSREMMERQRSVMPAVKIVSRAALPSESIGTPRLLVFFTSILLGLIAGVLLALLLELRPDWLWKRQN